MLLISRLNIWFLKFSWNFVTLVFKTQKKNPFLQSNQIFKNQATAFSWGYAISNAILLVFFKAINVFFKEKRSRRGSLKTPIRHCLTSLDFLYANMDFFFTLSHTQKWVFGVFSAPQNFSYIVLHFFVMCSRFHHPQTVSTKW
jgi:hypothetical protein